MRGSVTGDRLNSLATRGNEMELHSNNLEDGLKNPDVGWDSEEEGMNIQLTNGNGHKLTEAELCDTHGYELAMSPAGTIMPHDDDASWLSEDSIESQTTSLPKLSTEVEDFDLLEPFLLDSGCPSKRPGRVSELTWFSDDSSDSQNSIVKVCTEEFDQLETCLFTSEHASKPSDPIPDHGEPTTNSTENAYTATTAGSMHSTNEPSQAGQQGRSGKSIAETTVLVQGLVRRMTLGQKMKFYAWFNSGLSIEEAALKSKIPDLIPPPVRHPNCKLSKRRLQRLSKILPNVFLQRQFVYESYFAGVDPKQIMRYLMMGLESENLMGTFERQFTLEELATKEKLLRRNMRERTAAAAAAAASATTHAPTTIDLTSDPDRETDSGKSNSNISPRRTNGHRLKGDQLKKYYFLRKQGLSISEALSKAKMPGLDQEIMPHPDCTHSWEKLKQLAKALPNNISRETFLVEVYFKGKDAGEVLKIILSGQSDYRRSESNEVAEGGSGAAQNSFPENIADAVPSVDAAEVLIEKPSDQSETVRGMMAVESLGNAEVSMEKSFFREEDHRQRPDKAKSIGSRPKCSSSENGTKHEPKEVSSEKRRSNETDSTADPKHGVGPVPEALPNDENSSIPRMSLNQLKKYYKWCNQGFCHSEALAKAQIPGLIPKSISHLGCKHSWEEVKDMSDAISHKHERLKFQIEVYYGGKKPEEVMKKILANDNNQKPVAEDTTTALSQMSRNQLKKYYKWRILGLSSSEALSKAKIPGLVPETEGPHPDCKHSWDEIKEIGSALPTKSARDRFQVESFYGGKDPHELLKHMKPDADKNSNVSEPTVQANKAVLNSIDNGANLMMPSFLQNGLGIENTVSGGTGDVQLGFKNTLSEELDDVNLNTEDDTVLELSNRPLKKYYVWRNKGLSHNDALLKANSKSGNLSAKEANKLYVAHPDCKYSWDELIRMSLVLDEKGVRDRFLIHTFYGGMNPKCAIKLLKSRTPKEYLPSDDCTMPKSRKSRRKIRIKYLMGQGLTREEALKKLRNPSKKLLKELEEVILVNCGKEQVIQQSQSSLPSDQNRSNRAASTNIPLGSPYHPSNLLNDSQLINYYLWISNGCSREEAFEKVINGEPVSHEMYYLHYLRSKYDLEDVKKVSKNLPNGALAKTFVIETFYGQNDPEELMKFLSPLASPMNVSSCPKQHKIDRQDIVANPWFPSNKIQDAGPAEVPPTVAPIIVSNGLSHPDPALQLQFQANQGQSYLYGPNAVAEPPTVVCLPFQVQTASPTMAYSGYPQPTVDPDQTSYLNTANISDSSNQAPSSELEPPKAENPALEGSEVLCFIVPADFPNEILTESQMDAIENSILEAILEMDDEDTKPSFKDSFRTSGRYGIICNDEFSVGWLYKYLRVYEPWEGALLRLITNQADKITANAVLPLCKGDDDTKILKFIEKQNVDLNVGRWTVVQRWDSSDGNTLMDLIIDEESAEILRKCSRISFKLGTAEIITAQKNCSPSRSCEQSSSVTGSSRHDPPDCPPPLPSSPPPPSPPPPPPSPPKPCMIDTSLGALLKISASKCVDQDHSQKTCHNSATGRGQGFGGAIPLERGKRRSRKDSLYSRERKRSRPSSLDSCGLPVQRNSSPGRIHKRRRSKRDHERSASRSTSRDRTHRKNRRKCSKKDRKHNASRSPLRERSETNGLGGKNHTWLVQCRFYPGDKPSPDRFRRNLKLAPPRSTTPCSFISSEDNLSLPDDEPHPSSSSVGLRTVRAGSVENTEYDQYLGSSSCSKSPSRDLIDLTDST